MGRTALVGFHAAYIKKEGLPSESGVGNALVGSYLTQIGLSETAVVYITQAAPTEMTWLNLRDAKQIGIEVLLFQEQTPATNPAPPIPSRKASDYEECAESAVGEAKPQDALAILLSSCESKFTARRKRTGGYTFYDRRQNRHFDVAGPNPTPAELEYIERQYWVAELQKRQQIALRKIELGSTDIDCTFSSTCGTLTISLRNQSVEMVSSLSFGWVFLPPNELDCPTSLPTKHTQSVKLAPNSTTAINIERWDGPRRGQFRYCVRVTGAEIVPSAPTEPYDEDRAFNSRTGIPEIFCPSGQVTSPCR
jgi:hypothetical protein